MTRQARIILNPVGKKCRVELDGEEVQNCRAVTVSARVGGLTELTLEIINVEVTIEGDLHEAGVKLVDVTPIDAENRAYAKVNG